MPFGEMDSVNQCLKAPINTKVLYKQNGDFGVWMTNRQLFFFLILCKMVKENDGILLVDLIKHIEALFIVLHADKVFIKTILFMLLVSNDSSLN